MTFQDAVDHSRINCAVRTVGAWTVYVWRDGRYEAFWRDGVRLRGPLGAIVKRWIMEAAALDWVAVPG